MDNQNDGSPRAGVYPGAGRSQISRPHATQASVRVRRNFQNWILKRHAGAGEKFTEEEMDWLRMIRDHLATSFTIERDDLELAPFDAHGGLGRMFALFGDRMDDVMSEMNEALAA